MITGNKILPVALVAALLGGSVGAFVMRPATTGDAKQASATTPATTTAPVNALATADQPLASNTEANTQLSALDTTEERTAYREGFEDGLRAAQEDQAEARTTSNRGAARQAAPAATRVVYRDAPRTRRTRSTRASNSRQVYYDYEQPRKRSFWSKHRDKLTVAMGAGGGAVVGGLIGGKKGAAIGALAGGGGSALYTYKLRKRNRNY